MRGTDDGATNADIGRLAAGVGVVLALAAPVRAAGRTVYVPNFNSDSVSVFSVGSGTAGMIAAGPSPVGVAVTPDGKTAYVANFVQSGTVTPIHVATKTAGAPIAVGSYPGAVAVTPDGKTVYVANYGSGTVTPINVATNTAGGPIAVGASPGGVAVTPDGKTLYVTNELAAGTVTPIDLATHTAGAPIAVGGYPYAVAVTPDGKTLYVTNQLSSGTVTPIDVATNSAGAPIFVGVYPIGVAMAPDGKTAYVASFSSGDVMPIDVATNAVGDPLVVAGSVGSNAVAVTPDGKTVYVANLGSGGVDRVSPIDVASGTAGPPILVGSFPQSVAVVPDQGPVAVFSASAAPPGAASAFDGSGSSDPDGSVARYDWDFGDGTQLADGGPTPAHVYATPGTYAVSLTVTDDEGCSRALVFTGQTASCNAAPGARVTRSVAVGGAGGAEQTILGKSFSVTATPGAPTRTKVKVSASEKNSPNPLVGDPTGPGGAILDVFVDGGTPARQHFVLDQGVSSKGKPFWSGDAVRGFKYKDGTGEQGAVQAVSMKLKSGRFTIKAALAGKHAPLAILPPNPGTAACVALQLGDDGTAGHRYSVQFGPESRITNKGDRLFKATNPQTEGGCPTVYSSPSGAFLTPPVDLLD